MFGWRKFVSDLPPWRAMFNRALRPPCPRARALYVAAMSQSAGGEYRSNSICSPLEPTIWYRGEKIRLEGLNAPEVRGACNHEIALARQATERLRAILSSESFTVSRHGKDRYGQTLATIRNSRGDVARILIAEGLAHEWRGHKESRSG